MHVCSEQGGMMQLRGGALAHYVTFWELCNLLSSIARLGRGASETAQAQLRVSPFGAWSGDHVFIAQWRHDDDIHVVTKEA